MIYYYIIILIILFYSIKTISKNTTPINKLIDRSYPENNDSISILLDRIEWTNHYPGRIQYIFRFIIYSIIISLINSIIIYNKLPDGKIFIQLMLGIFIVLLTLNSFFSHHADKFASYSIEKNVKFLRKKLGVKRGDFNKLSRRKKHFSGKDNCFTFFYKY